MQLRPGVLGRAARMLYEGSAVYRVPPTHSILRVAFIDLSKPSTPPPPSAAPVLLQSCLAGMAVSFVGTGGPSAVGDALPSSSAAAGRSDPEGHDWRHRALHAWAAGMARWHLARHSDTSSPGVPVPVWHAMTAERVELDMAWPGGPGSITRGEGGGSVGSGGTGTGSAGGGGEHRGGGGFGLERCNVVVLLHPTEDRPATTRALDATLAALPPTLPVVLCGVVKPSAVAQGDFGLTSVHGRWAATHAELAQAHPRVYACDYACPEAPGQGFHLLYKAQMAALYPKDRLLPAPGHAGSALDLAAGRIFEQCDLAGDGVWCSADVDAFFLAVYGRPATQPEWEALIAQATGSTGAGAEDGVLTPAQLREWLERLAGVGKSDVAWAILRAFGFDGRLERAR